MKLVKASLVAAAVIGTAACGGGGNSDNVMSPEANALEPAEVNAALGPEVTNSADINATTNDVNAVGNSSGNSMQPDEPAGNSGG